MIENTHGNGIRTNFQLEMNTISINDYQGTYDNEIKASDGVKMDDKFNVDDQKNGHTKACKNSSIVLQ